MTREDEWRELLAVTQDDRDAAADLYDGELGDALWFTKRIREGAYDDCAWVQAFAKHRLASTRPSSPASGEVERYSAIYQSKLAERYMRERDEARAALAALTVPARPEAGEVESYAAFQQKRGRLPDLIEEAIGIYDEFMKDDDYRSQNCLDRVVTKLREARDFYDASLPTARAGIGEDAAQHFKVGDRVTKVKGLPFGNGDARVVAVYSAEGGSRVVVQHPEGWQHIFAPDQLALASLQSSGNG